MPSVYELKEQAVTDTPLLLFDCLLAGGREEHWCTHRVTVGGIVYEARVLEHSAFEIQTASDQGVDGSPRISVLLANADSHFSEIERAEGWKGARLTAGFLFYDLRGDTPVTDTTVVFQGICNPPEEIRETTIRLTAINRMNLQRLLLPQVRIQRRCPWEFPATAEQRAEAVDGGAQGGYSRFYRCGYSPDAAGGRGNLDNGSPFPSCGYTRAACQARGMLNRFGGIEFVPPEITVRAYGKDPQTSAVAVNQARYNDFVPMVYGTAWYAPPLVFARNDGNLTRMEALLGIGEMQGVLTVLVNGVEIPLGVTGANMTGTGWYNIPTLGTRDGGFDLNFLDASGQPAGDPFGSMAYLAIAVPTRLSSGTSLPSVKVLVQGLKLPMYAADGSYTDFLFSANPAWILLDILRRSGWAACEIDIPSFAVAAAFCDEQINTCDLHGNPITIPRFQCNLVLQSRRSGGDVVRGIRNAARLYLTYGPAGVLQLRVENTAALEQPVKPANSNSTEPLDGGWPSYEFGDGSNGFTGILRRANREPSVVVSSRGIADTPNRITVEFQDALNGYQQDSYSMVDPEDVARAGQEVAISLKALGLPNYDQAARILKFNLDKSIRGNTYIEFQTSVRAVGIRPGNLITVTYLKEGFNRQPFRVLKIAPATNYRTSMITAQIHDDAWYADTNGQTNSPAGTGHQANAGVGIPRPLVGSVLDENGDIQFGVVETAAPASDGSTETSASVSFVPPAVAPASGPGVPLISLITTLGTGGSLDGGQVLYYAVSGVDDVGQESVLSFIVRAAILSNASTVTLSGLSFAPGTASFHVYRGNTPAALFRIASDQPLAGQFTDTGLAPQLVAPPDPHFDHANFYWRRELEPELAATIHSPTAAGNSGLQLDANAYRGMTARITRGPGAGQERIISSNDRTVLTVAPPWTVEPDAASFFVVAEAGWHFGAQTRSSPVEFPVPNRSGEVVQITGRAANVNDLESAPELAVVTRWVIGGSGGADTDVPPVPSFGFSAGAHEGFIEVSGVSFDDLTNTHSISSATLTVHYWDELQPAPATLLGTAAADSDPVLNLSAAGPSEPGNILQLEAEVVRVESVEPGGLIYHVTRGIHGSPPAAHAGGTPVYHLLHKTSIAPFPPDFFGSPYCGGWGYSISLPDARVASAELFVTNRKGNSPPGYACLTGTVDRGLRTLSGGQYSIQVEGYLAVAQSAAPPLLVDTVHAVRDIFAVVGKAADAPIQLQLNVNGEAYCQLTVPAAQFVSNSISGSALPPLPAGAQITLAVLAVGQIYPGADLTVLIRL